MRKQSRALGGGGGGEFTSGGGGCHPEFGSSTSDAIVTVAPDVAGTRVVHHRESLVLRFSLSSENADADGIVQHVSLFSQTRQNSLLVKA